MSDAPHDTTRLRPGSLIVEATEHYRRWLVHMRRPPNTIKAYVFDLQILARAVPSKSINQVSTLDIGRFLADANSTATRKRRLTTLRQFYRYLIDEAKVLSIDPTADVYPNRIELNAPRVLSPAEQAAMLAAARDDEPWAALAVSLMLILGLTRAEILEINRGSIDRSDPEKHVVSIVTDDLRRPTRSRSLFANAPIPEIYETFLKTVDPEFRLFPFGFQAINGMVERVRRRAGIEQSVSPRTLRDTYISNRLIAGASEVDLLRDLGLASDLRNRQSIRRFRPAQGAVRPSN